jgi:hypothetical protein
MTVDALLQFYNPIPRYGEHFADQVPDMRDNSNSLSTLVRAAFADTDSPARSGGLNLSGLALGEQGFRNRFRTFYDKAADEYKMQFNSGTEGVPVWTTCVRIRQDDCRFIIQGTGGLELHGGFYGGSNLNTTINVRDSEDPVLGARSTASLVFNSTDGFYTSGTSNAAETMVNFEAAASSGEANTASNNAGDEGIFFQKVGVDLEFKSLTAGANITLASDNDEITITGSASGGGSDPGFYGITVAETGGGNEFTGLERVDFNSGSFYVTQNTRTDRAIVNFRGTAGGGVTDHGALTGLSDDDHTQYTKADGTRAFSGDQSMGGNQLTNVGAPAAATDAARLADIGPGFYGITVAETGGGNEFTSLDRIDFETANFYVTQNTRTDRAIVSFRGSDSTAGEANTASNNAGDEGIFFQKVGVDLEFKSLTAGSNITLGSTDDAITITGAAGGAADGGFYGINVGQTDDNPLFSGINTIKFAAGEFYVTQNAPNTDETIISLRTPADDQTTGMLGVGEWRYNTTTTAPPGDKQLRFNNANIPSTTELYIDYTNLANDDVTNLLTLVRTGTLLYFQNRTDSSQAILITVATTTDQTDYLEVTYTDVQSTQQTFANNTRFALVIGAVGAVTDHGALDGLADDDHTQYARTDGTRNITGHQRFDDTINVENAVTGEAFYLGVGGIYNDASGNVIIDPDGAGTNYVRALRNLVAGDPGGEGNSISVGGTDYESALKASDIGGANEALIHMHRHSDSLPAAMVASRARGTTNGHSALQDGDAQFAIISTGRGDTTYEIGGQIRFVTDGDSPGDDNMPTRIDFHPQAPGGAGAATAAMSIHPDKHVSMNAGLNVENIATAEAFYSPSLGEVASKSEVGGEANTASNNAGDEGIFFQKAGVDLEFKSLTAGANITLGSTDDTITITGSAGGGGGGGFYGVLFRESEAGGYEKKSDELQFDSNDFYMTSAGNGKPLVSLIPIAGGSGATKAQETFGSAVEWQMSHGLSVTAPGLVWSTYDDGMEAIIPKRVDMSDSATAYFYFSEAVAGTAVVIG